MTPPPCPLCQSTHTRVWRRFQSPPGVTQRFTIRRCGGCGHLFTDPVPTGDLLDRIYHSPQHVNFQTSDQHFEGRRAIDDGRWHWLRSHLSGGMLIDFGSGSGAFLSRAPSTFRVVGAEPTDRLAHFARESKGLEICPSLAEATERAGKADAVTMWDVFEHLDNPAERLREIAQSLKPGGHIVIGVPNCRAFEATLFGGSWFAWCVPAHLHHWTPESISRTLGENGFEVVDIDYSHHPFITLESWKMALGWDMSGMGVFTGWPSVWMWALAVGFGWSRKLSDWAGRKIERGVWKHIAPERRAAKRNQMTVLARLTAPSTHA